MVGGGGRGNVLWSLHFSNHTVESARGKRGWGDFSFDDMESVVF